MTDFEWRLFFVNGRWEVREIKGNTSKQKSETSGEWCLPCVPFFPQNDVLLFVFHTEQCLSEINTTQRERGRQTVEERGGRETEQIKGVYEEKGVRK